MVADLTGLQRCDDNDDDVSFDPSDTGFMDSDEPPLHTREARKRFPKVTRTRNSVDVMVRFRPTFRYPYTRN
jgi:hypothetical protein